MKFLCSVSLMLLSAVFSFGQWNTNTSVNLEVSGKSVSDLQTATTRDGKTWIAFYSLRSGNYDMRAQLLDINGNKLLGADGMVVSSATSGTATFVFNVCLDANDNLVIAYQYQSGNTMKASLTKVNTDGSLPWGSEGIALGNGLAPYPTLLPNNEIVVTWSNNSPSTLYMHKITDGGGLAWTTPVAVNVGTSTTTRGQIVANNNGDFTLIFQKKSFGISTTLYAQRYNTNGVAQWAAPVQLSNLTTSGARYYSVLSDGDVTYCGYYASAGVRFASYLQRINANGSLPWGINGQLFSTYTGNSPMQQTTNIAHTAGSPYVWGVCTYSDVNQTQYGVYVQKFNALTGAVLLNSVGKVVYPVSASFDTQAGALSLANDAPFFITYDANYKIYATKLDAAGNFSWSTNRVEMSSTTATLSQPKGRFAFAAGSVDQGVAVWTETRGGIEKAYAQAINSFGILPITFNDFRAVKSGKVSNLFWTTTTENNCKGFYIERSSNGSSYQKIGFVSSKAIGGISSSPIDYIFTDLMPLQKNNYYRIKQVDLDDRYSYSKTILVQHDNQETLLIKSLYPIPANTSLRMNYESNLASSGTLSIVDMNGKILKRLSVSFIEGENVFDVDVNELAKGTYYIWLNTTWGGTYGKAWTK